MSSRKLGLPIKRADTIPQLLNILVYGDSKVGKTRFAETAQACPTTSPTLLCHIDTGAPNLTDNSIDLVEITDYKELDKVYDFLATGDSGYKSVIVDSLSAWYRKVARHFVQRAHTKDPTKNDELISGLQDHLRGYNATLLFCERFLSLPLHTIVTMGAEDVIDGETNVIRTRPSVAGKLRSEIPGFFDVVGYMAMEGAKRSQPKTDRVMHLQNSFRVIAGMRAPNEVPAYIENPTVSALLGLAGITA